VSLFAAMNRPVVAASAARPPTLRRAIPVERRPAERVQRRGGDRAARGPDRAGRPIDQLDQDTRAAPEHAAQPQQHERASACGVVTGRQARTRYTICTKRRGLASPGAARARAFVAWWLHLDRT
jgi:hypothetical protein